MGSHCKHDDAAYAQNSYTRKNPQCHGMNEQRAIIKIMLKRADRGWGKVWLCIGIAEEVDVDKLVGLKVWRGNVFLTHTTCAKNSDYGSKRTISYHGEQILGA